MICAGGSGQRGRSPSPARITLQSPAHGRGPRVFTPEKMSSLEGGPRGAGGGGGLRPRTEAQPGARTKRLTAAPAVCRALAAHFTSLSSFLCISLQGLR